MWTEEEATSALQAVIKRATTDSSFRSLCLSNPAGAVRQETGKDLPEGFTIRMIENEGANLTIVLPDVRPKGELSDADLEQVAGGKACNAQATCGVSDVCGVSKGKPPDWWPV